MLQSRNSTLPSLPFVFLLLTFAVAITAIRIPVSPHSKPMSQESDSGAPAGGMNLYELSARPWLYNLTQKYGKPITHLLDVPDAEWKAIKAYGFDIVFIMGVWQLGQYGLNYDKTNPALLAQYPQVLPGFNIADVIGSPYAVTNYTCNTQICSTPYNDLSTLKQKLNSMGLLLMLDYVPNHTAVDCAWATTHPEYYVRATKGTNPPYDSNYYTTSGIAYGSAGYGGSWQDTLQINIWNPDVRKIRTEEVLSVASVADGIRCDMAYLELNSVFSQSWGTQLSSWGYTKPATEWWSDTIKAVKSKYPNILFLAEVYSPYESTLQGLGFDYTYDKVIRDKLGAGNLDDIRGWIASLTPSYIAHSVHYISNHDEQRGPTYFGSWYQSDAAAALLYTLPGMRYYWMWDMDGFKYQLDIHLRREQSEQANPTVESFYKTLLAITSDPVFKLGQWTNLNVSNGNGSDTAWRLIAYRWSYQNERRLCVINFSDTQGWGNIILPNAMPGPNNNDTVPVTELITNTVYYRSASQMRTGGLTVGVNSWYAQILQY